MVVKVLFDLVLLPVPLLQLDRVVRPALPQVLLVQLMPSGMGRVSCPFSNRLVDPIMMRTMHTQPVTADSQCHHTLYPCKPDTKIPVQNKISPK